MELGVVGSGCFVIFHLSESMRTANAGRERDRPSTWASRCKIHAVTRGGVQQADVNITSELVTGAEPGGTEIKTGKDGKDMYIYIAWSWSDKIPGTAQVLRN